MKSVLDRDRVVNLFRVIFDDCSQIEGKSLKLMPPDADSVYSKGYQIHFSIDKDENLEACIKRIAEANELATIKEKNILIIFNPIEENDR